ncbi:MAG: DUF4990 domain-containing protein [Prevotella sp.]|nr:DUF4990 domain-containing protein [Prevotella sp.]
MKKTLMTILMLAVAITMQAGHVFISPEGNDTTGDGSMEKPYATLPKAISRQIGILRDTIWIRGGRYVVTTDQVMAYKENNLYAAVFDLSKSGTATRNFCYFAYPGDERPVFDFSQVKPAGKRVSAFYIEGNYLHLKGFDIVGVQVTITTHTQSEGISIRQNCGYNTIEDVRIHDGMSIGVYITRGHDNLILNCDAYNNYDSVSESGQGGNSDGFGCHVAAEYTGNVFRGCRAWRNSDDGFDLINCYAPVTFDHCWAWQNGFDANLVSRGDGNGFKAGGFGAQVQSASFDAPRHTISNCIAWDNKANGFYANHHLGGNDWVNNSAYANRKYNFNLVNQKSWDDATDVPGYAHLVRNNMSYQGKAGNYTNISTTECTLENNNFLPTFIRVADTDFESLDAGQLLLSRQADGSLPDISFLRFKSDAVGFAQELGYQFDMISTGIRGMSMTAIPSSVVTANTYYNLQGIKVMSPLKGQVYIHRGNKVVY